MSSVILIRNFLREIRRRMKLTPMHKVLRELKKRNVRLKDLHTLEVFGYTGEFHTKDYAPYISTLEIWEINEEYKDALMRNFPRAKIKITDSFREIKNTSTKYNLIIVDNPMSTYGNNNEYCEHFELFPDIFRVAMDSAIFILNVIPEINSVALKRYPNLFNETQLARRSLFYKTNRPYRVSFEEIVRTYRDFAMSNNFVIPWYFFQKRTFVWYLILKLRKQSPS